jgi:hypothetical protein
MPRNLNNSGNNNECDEMVSDEFTHAAFEKKQIATSKSTVKNTPSKIKNISGNTSDKKEKLTEGDLHKQKIKAKAQARLKAQEEKLKNAEEIKLAEAKRKRQEEKRQERLDALARAQDLYEASQEEARQMKLAEEAKIKDEAVKQLEVAKLKEQAEIIVLKEKKLAEKEMVRAERQASKEAKALARKQKIELVLQKVQENKIKKDILIQKIVQQRHDFVLSVGAWFRHAFMFFFKASVLIIGLLTLVIVVIHFVNLSVLIEPLERAVSKETNMPVSIQTVHVSLLPSMRLTLGGVSLGHDRLIEARKLAIKLVSSDSYNRLLGKQSFANSPYLIDSIEIDGLIFKQVAFKQAQQLLTSLSKAKRIDIRQILLSQANIQLNRFNFPNVDGEIQLTKGGEISNISLSNEEKSLVFNMVPSLNNYLISIEASHWRLPLSSNILMSNLNAKAILEGDRLTFTQIDGDVYNGKIKATAVVDLAENSKVDGVFQVDGVSLTEVERDTKRELILKGSLHAKARFSIKQNSVLEFDAVPDLDADFTIENGFIDNVDFVRAMMSDSGQTRTTEPTKFTQLTGKLVLRDPVWQFKHLILQNKQFSARGNLNMDGNGILLGEVWTSLALQTRLVKYQFKITGSSDGMVLIH